ncbi:MAG: hypothetical protein D6736_18905 [Nitrospinota bacterium]|nr:MAG: hypothetical protein D6736_18905 [Nitrospinota bacterium]
MKDTELLLSQLKSLEMQLRVLQARIQFTTTQPVSSASSFAELYGRLQGQVESSEEEIDAVLYRLPDNNNFE